MDQSAPGGAWEPPSATHETHDGAPVPFGSVAATPGFSGGAAASSGWVGTDLGSAYVAAPLQSGWEPVGSFAAAGGWSAEGAPKAGRGRLPLMVVLLVLAIGAAIAAPFVLDRSTPGSAVDAALVSTLVDNTVQTTFTFTVAQGTLRSQLTGSAKTDAAGKKFAITLSITAAATKLTLHVIADGTAVYLSAPGVLNLPTGKAWVEVTEGKLRSALPPGSTSSIPDIAVPASPIAALEKAGATVTTEGTSSIDGVTVQSYKMTLGMTSVISLLTSYGLPASDAGSLRSSGLAPIVLTVDVDGTGRVRYVGGSTTDTSGGKTATVSASAQFSNYGQPVTVTPPPATQTATFLQVIGPLTNSPVVGQLLAAG